MDITTGAKLGLRYPAARLNEKGCLQVCGGDAPSFHILMWWKHGLKFGANFSTSMCSLLALPPPHCFYSLVF
jgi:hypothetical protein